MSGCAPAAPRNPVLPGFHPDPCLCRVGDDYYLATSTFEWFPGVALHHSRDLAHWRAVGHALTRTTQLDLRGVPASGGIWAPALSFADGRFWLVFTVVTHWAGYKDAHNYLVTAPLIEGPWSEPVFLCGGAFDPSLFHDADGRKWLLSTRWDHRPGKNRFNGIRLREFDPQAQRLVGEAHTIFTGTALGITEGPHLYRRGGFYYLVTAEGGTHYGHAVTLARSRALDGPYTVDPGNPMLTARSDHRWPLQKAGHASLVETPDGAWKMAFLCARPLPGSDCCPLGRETALADCEWTADGWLRVCGGPRPPTGAPRDERMTERIEFDAPVLPASLQTLRREPAPDWLSLDARPGWLRLIGGESLRSHGAQSLVARRLQHFRARVETCVEFAPVDFQQMAGLAAYYSSAAYFFLHVTWDETDGRCLRLHTFSDGELKEPLPAPIGLPAHGAVRLALEFDGPAARFAWSLDGAAWGPAGDTLETARLSDDWRGFQGFTGCMIALSAQDLSGAALPADFDYLHYTAGD